jgi:hypothetical protein
VAKSGQLEKIQQGHKVSVLVDPDPAFHLNAAPDPDPERQINADSHGSGSGSWSDFAVT